MRTRGIRLGAVGCALVLVSVVAWQFVGTFTGGGGAQARPNPYPGVLLQNTYTVAAGDTISVLAHRFGVSQRALMKANGIANANLIYAGQRLVIPSVYHYWKTDRTIRRISRRFGLDPAFGLAVAWEESGFQEKAVSRTGAIGIMQIEPSTAVQLSRDLGQVINLGRERDNVKAGVYYLRYLVRYYGGNERSAAAAYYEGQGNLARRGYVGDTRQYVADIMSLRHQFRDGVRR